MGPPAPVVVSRPMPLGNPRLVPFRNDNSNKWLLTKTIENHIPSFMCSNILDGDTHTIQLWYPRPLLAGTDGQMRSIEVGDLVYLDESGEFRVVFNIFRSYEDNKHIGAKPPPKPYEHLPANLRAEHVKEVDIQKEKYYLSDNFQHVRTKPSPRPYEKHYEFTTKKPARSGAIIVLPHGGVHSFLRNAFFQPTKVKHHFRDHAPSWYQHVKNIRPIPNLENGSLLLVRETYRSKTWGIAAFESKHRVKDPITVTYRQHGYNAYEYLWVSQDNRVKTNVGPSNSELEALQGREPPLNQCIGLVLSALHLDDATWRMHFTSPAAENKATSVKLFRSMSLESNSSRGSSQRSSLQRLSLLRSFRGKNKQDKRSSHVGVEEGEFGDYELLIQET